MRELTNSDRFYQPLSKLLNYSENSQAYCCFYKLSCINKGFCIGLDWIGLDCIALHCIVLYCIVLYRIVSYRIVSYRIVSYRNVLYCIVLYCSLSNAVQNLCYSYNSFYVSLAAF